ncbi:MAG: hypothetical protein JSR45_09360 [Proteobacteria bacterium]|nr:hypothetical protein [Pseudomonadota bacterium]
MSSCSQPFPPSPAEEPCPAAARERQSREFAAAVADIAEADQPLVLGILRQAATLSDCYGEAVAEAALEHAVKRVRGDGQD